MFSLGDTAGEVRYSVIHCMAQDKEPISIATMHVSSPNHMFDHLLESSRRDDSYKWSNIGFGEEIIQVLSIEVYCTHLIRSCRTL